MDWSIFSMERYGDNDAKTASIDCVATFYSSQNKTIRLKNGYQFPCGKWLHAYRAKISTSSIVGRATCRGIGIRDDFSSSIQSSSTSLAFFFASSNVRPKVTHPG